MACTGSAGAAPAASGTVHSCGTSVSLPKDEAPHSAPVEWWYFSGHLSGKDAKGHVHAYGYEDVIFQFLGLAPQPIYLGDMSVTDLTRKTFKFAGEQGSYPVPKTADRFALHAGSWTMSGGSGRDTLKAGIPGYSVDLGLATSEPAILEGNKCGHISMASLGSSYYYSWTSLVTTGTIVDHGVKLKVTGKSWIDHQWGPIAETAGTRVADGGKHISYLTAANISEKVTGSWTSPATRIKYGSGWKVTVPGGQLTVTPDLRNQEVDLLKTQMNVYWEGDVTIKGKIGGATVGGDGYTELVPTAP
jgi:predicted secreted hydrolase